MGAWDLYKSLRLRSLYKNKWLSAKGYSAAQRSEIMRKFKVYVDRIEQSPIGVKVRSTEKFTQVVWIIDSLFNNEWKNYIKDSYRDMPYFFHDYAKFLDVVQKFVQGEDVCLSVWPDGSPVCRKDIAIFAKTKHSRIKLTIGDETNIYSGSKALIEVCRCVGLSETAKVNLATNGLKLLVRHVPLGRETRYMKIEDGWYLCTSCDTKVKLRLIKIIASHFRKDIKVELV